MMASSSQWVLKMPTKGDPHIDNEIIEQYSSGDLSPYTAARVEEHLLVCELCQGDLEANDAYVAAMQAAAAKLRQAEQPASIAARRAAGRQ
jgi:anti-sigma factor RsiW